MPEGCQRGARGGPEVRLRGGLREASGVTSGGLQGGLRGTSGGPQAMHIPYRSWCRHCVIGRATNRSHGKAPAEEDEEEKRKSVPQTKAKTKI